MPVELRGLITSPQAGQGLALLAPSIAPEQSRAFREGDAISTGVVLRRITDDGIELDAGWPRRTAELEHVRATRETGSGAARPSHCSPRHIAPCR